MTMELARAGIVDPSLCIEALNDGYVESKLMNGMHNEGNNNASLTVHTNVNTARVDVSVMESIGNEHEEMDARLHLALKNS